MCKPSYSYRVPYVPKGGNVPPSGVLPFIQVQATDAESAQRHAYATAPAEAVLEPDRLGEVVCTRPPSPPRAVRPLSCPRCRHIAQTVVCHQCGEFKVARSVPSFAHELDEAMRIEQREAA